MSLVRVFWSQFTPGGWTTAVATQLVGQAVPDYDGRVILRFGPLVAGIVFVQLTGGVLSSAKAGDKYIQLRNERIHTVAPSRGGAASATPGPLSQAQVEPVRPGSELWLIQFTGPVESSWRELLRAEGVELLWHVPEDAFVARCKGARPGPIRALPFVQWVGDYRPEHKVHRSLPNAAGAGNATSCE